VSDDSKFFLPRRSFLSLGLLLLPRFQLSQDRIRFLPYDRVAPVLASNTFDLPTDLKGTNDARRVAWPRWIQNHDRAIRARLVRGEEDTLVNFVLFGVSFTDRPRVVLEPEGTAEGNRLIGERIQQFIAALDKPATDRLVLLKNLVTRQGHSFGTAAEKDRLRQYVSQQVTRYLAEWREYRLAVERSRGGIAASAANTTGLYKNRGLSVDTDFRPNYAIEQSLAEAKRRALLKSVKNVAIVGPGLDFTDKDSGFDYYPLQTLQPFALIDSLLRLELARPSDLKVSVFDISSQALDHVSRAVRQGRGNQAYPLQLVLDRGAQWTTGAVEYWRRLGDRIGVETTPMSAPPQIQNVDRRAVQIRPAIVTLLDPQPLNIVSQYLDAPVAERFDLIVATNVFLYYDRFELALAMLNVESMLNPGGVMLSNDVIEGYSGIRLRSVRDVTVQYTPSEADQVRIYSMPTFQPQLAPA